MTFEPRCGTTAMGIMPHDDVDRALSLALSLDVPFWPQLHRISLYEDSYVQASEHFPGIAIDPISRRIVFDLARFYEELPEYAELSASPDFFSVSPRYSTAFHKFLASDLSGHLAIRGQCMGPISFGLKVVDEDLKPIIYRDDIRSLLIDFLQAKVNWQYRQLKAKNRNAFVWLDEPGLQVLFSAYSGYTGEAAKADLRTFFQGIEGWKGVHLCGNPDWDLLLSIDLDILSLDSYHWGQVFIRYYEQVKSFVERGGILVWGLAPTGAEDFALENAERLMRRLEGYWDYLAGKGADKERLLRQSLLSPATCCLLNADVTETVESAFGLVRDVSRMIKDKYGL